MEQNFKAGSAAHCMTLLTEARLCATVSQPSRECRLRRRFVFATQRLRTKFSKLLRVCRKRAENVLKPRAVRCVRIARRVCLTSPWQKHFAKTRISRASWEKREQRIRETRRTQAYTETRRRRRKNEVCPVFSFKILNYLLFRKGLR